MPTVSVFQGKDSRRQKIEQQLRRLQCNYKGISVKIEWGEQRNPFQTGECQKEEPKMWCSHFLWHTSSIIYQSCSVRYTHIQKAMQSLIFKVIKYNTSDLNSAWILLSKCYSSQVNLRASPFYADQIEHVDGKWERNFTISGKQQILAVSSIWNKWVKFFPIEMTFPLPLYASFDFCESTSLSCWEASPHSSKFVMTRANCSHVYSHLQQPCWKGKQGEQNSTCNLFMWKFQK